MTESLAGFYAVGLSAVRHRSPDTQDSEATAKAEIQRAENAGLRFS